MVKGLNKKYAAHIAGAGAYLPERIQPNAEFESFLDTNDAWIRERTGIRSRHMAAAHENTSDLALKASQKALKHAGMRAENMDMIIMATTTPDYTMPSTACLLQHKLGARNAACFDIQAVCAGFVYALSVAVSFIQSGSAKNVLVVGAEILTRILNYHDRGTCILFGDGAGAVVLRASRKKGGVLSCCLGADGSGWNKIFVPAGGTAEPASEESVRNQKHTMTMKGKEVFEFAVRIIPDIVTKSCRLAGVGVDDLSWFVPHQANHRIIQSAARRLNMSEEKILGNIHETGNTSAASIPLVLSENAHRKKIKSGDLICLASFGAGLTYGASVVQWS